MQDAVAAQHKVLKKIAENGSSVIVGRAADYVLSDYPELIRVFIYAPGEYRVKRIMEVYGDTEDEARKNIRHSDEARSAYYHSISGKKWGERENYDILLDSSIGEEAAADIITGYAIKRFRNG